MTSLLSVVYASSAVRPFEQAELVELLRSSRASNVRHGITGMLLYRGGNIIQALEGEETAVWRLYELIESDPRHKDVSLLSRTAIEQREFESWHMGFRNIDKMPQEELEGFVDILRDDFSPQYFSENPTRASILLSTFREMVL